MTALGQAYEQKFRFDMGIQRYNGYIKVGKFCLYACKIISKVPFPMQKHSKIHVHVYCIQK